MDSSTIRVTCCQLAPVLGDLAGNRALTVRAITDAVAGGADVVVLPELATSGYCFDSAAQLDSVAVTADHEVFTDWSAAAGSAVVIGGFAERGPGGVMYNSSVVVDHTGVRAVYRKIHLWDSEKLWFAEGTEPPPVVDTDHGRIGLLICYDLEFPELVRSLALRGADLLAVPTNWPLVETPAGEHVPEVMIGMAAARVNRVFIACADRTGVERGQHWNEGTSVLSASGWVLDSVGAGTGFATADLDLAEARDKNISGRNHLFDDRRPALYEASP